MNDEQVQIVVRTHLLDLPVGDITATQFHCALNKHILPSLGYMLRRSGLSLHMAQRWLCKLEWWHIELKKGVYMDGHKQSDIVEYYSMVFLPLMASLEKQMVQWVPKGSKLEHIDLNLGPGEKRVIILFQDESSFHVNEYTLLNFNRFS